MVQYQPDHAYSCRLGDWCSPWTSGATGSMAGNSGKRFCRSFEIHSSCSGVPSGSQCFVPGSFPYRCQVPLCHHPLYDEYPYSCHCISVCQLPVPGADHIHHPGYCHSTRRHCRGAAESGAEYGYKPYILHFQRQLYRRPVLGCGGRPVS